MAKSLARGFYNLSQLGCDAIWKNLDHLISDDTPESYVTYMAHVFAYIMITDSEIDQGDEPFPRVEVWAAGWIDQIERDAKVLQISSAKLA